MRRGQRGAAIPTGMVVIWLLITLTLALVMILGAFVTKRHVQSGADLAALAGAVAVQNQADACEEVSNSAHANKVEVVGCHVEGDVVTVTVKRKTTKMFGRQLTVEATARAGPQDAR